MSRSYIPKELRRKVAAQAHFRCGFCLTSEILIASQMDVEHIIPEAMGGQTIESNLWLCCPKCNGFKSDKTSTEDPDTKQVVPLFNPRQQIWSDHFKWSDDGALIIGKTPVGRVTVLALQLNRPHLVASRLVWIGVGLHPPQD